VSDVFGIHAVQAALENTPERVRAVYVRRGREEKKQILVELAKAAGIRVEFVDARWLDRRADGVHQGVVADCHDIERNWLSPDCCSRWMVSRIRAIWAPVSEVRAPPASRPCCYQNEKARH
jgi:hypothetical protein